MLARLGDKNEQVVASATTVLGNVANFSNEVVIERLKRNLNHENAWVQRQTLASVARLTTKGDRNTIADMAQCLNHTCHTVRLQAVKALTDIADSKDPQCIGDLVQILNRE